MNNHRHDAITGGIEGVAQGKHAGPIFTAEATKKINAKLAAGKSRRLQETAKFKEAPESLKRKMKHAAHLRRLRTLRGIWNPEDE